MGSWPRSDFPQNSFLWGIGQIDSRPPSRQTDISLLRGPRGKRPDTPTLEPPTLEPCPGATFGWGRWRCRCRCYPGALPWSPTLELPWSPVRIMAMHLAGVVNNTTSYCCRCCYCPITLSPVMETTYRRHTTDGISNRQAGPFLPRLLGVGGEASLLIYSFPHGSMAPKVLPTLEPAAYPGALPRGCPGAAHLERLPWSCCYPGAAYPGATLEPPTWSCCYPGAALEPPTWSYPGATPELLLPWRATLERLPWSCCYPGATLELPWRATPERLPWSYPAPLARL